MSNPRITDWITATKVARTNGFIETHNGPADQRRSDRTKDWQFQISFLPTSKNCRRAVKALAKVFSQDREGYEGKTYLGYDWIDFKGLVLKACDTKESETAFRAENPTLRGKEFCVTMHFENGAYFRSPWEYKKLMLRCWKALYEAGVTGIGYMPSPADSQPIPVQDGMVTPLSYKAMADDHAINPLEGIRITAKDLSDVGIPLECSDDIFKERVNYSAIEGNVAEQTAAQEAQANYLALMNQEIQNLRDLIIIIKDDSFWKTKHRTQSKLPTGINELQCLYENYETKLQAAVEDPKKSLSLMREFYSQCNYTVINRSIGYKRHPMTKNLYQIFYQEPQFGALTQNQAFKELKRAAINPLERPAAVDLLVNVIRDSAAWKSRHHRDKTKLPTGIQKLQECLKPYLNEAGQIDPRQFDSLFARCKHVVKQRMGRGPSFFAGKKRDPQTIELYRIIAECNDIQDLNSQITKLEAMLTLPIPLEQMHEVRRD